MLAQPKALSALDEIARGLLDAHQPREARGEDGLAEGLDEGISDSAGPGHQGGSRCG